MRSELYDYDETMAMERSQKMTLTAKERRDAFRGNALRTEDNDYGGDYFRDPRCDNRILGLSHASRPDCFL